MKSGIYKIINRTNGKYYVGSSVNWQRRKVRHKHDLNHNIHDNVYLQRSWNKHGKDNFEFMITEKCDPILLIKREQDYLDIAKAEKDKCYNMTFEAGRPPKWTDEQRHIISIKFSGVNNPNYGKHHSEETRLKMRMAKLGRPNEKVRVARLGTHNSKEQNRKIGLASIGNKYRVGKTLSPNHKSKLLASLIGSNNARFDHKVYDFHNLVSNETFTGTRYDLQHKFGLSCGDLCRVVHGNRKHVKQWALRTTL